MVRVVDWTVTLLSLLSLSGQCPEPPKCPGGQYSPDGYEGGKYACTQCEAGKYVNVTGATTCLECTKACPFPGTFELISCTGKANTVCEVYVHDVPETAKIVIACGQSPLVVLICYLLFQSKLRSAMQNGEDWHWWNFCIFALGVHDVVSDFTTLSLIPIKNPFFLFWVSLVILLCSVVTCLWLSFYSKIDLIWPLRVLVFMSSSAADYGQGLPEKWNSRVMLCVENVPQLVVQSILLYLQGSVGFSGWDWVILGQSLLFSIMSCLVKLRKLRKDLWERMDQLTGVAAAGVVSD